MRQLEASLASPYRSWSSFKRAQPAQGGGVSPTVLKVLTDRLLPRRAMLQRCLGMIGLGRVASRPAQDSGFRDLQRSVHVPLDALSEPWRPVEFDARTVDAAGRPLLLKGAVLRTPSTADRASEVKALCLTCPHEICYVTLRDDTRTVPFDAGPRPDHPLFVCACHFSVFDPVADGARLSGPSERGLFRFRLDLESDMVRITQVEEAILTFLA